MRVQNFVHALVVMGFNKRTAGIVNNRPVAAPANIVQQPADERGLAHANGAVNEIVHDLGVLNHVQSANLQIGLLTGLFQQPVNLFRLISKGHARDKLVLTLLLTDATHIPGNKAPEQAGGDTAGAGDEAQVRQELAPHVLHPRIGQQLRGRQLYRAQLHTLIAVPENVPRGFRRTWGQAQQ